MQEQKQSRDIGILYLVPCPISDDNIESVGQEVISTLKHLKYYIVERAKTTRKFIKMLVPEVTLQELIINELDKEDPKSMINELMAPIFEGIDVGLMSEAGNPCIADPGALVVAYAHDHNIQVKPLTGPSSILLALIASGFNGQSFSFHGYLPNKKETLLPRLKQLENAVQKYNQTQIFMETPYRNEFMIEAIVQILSPSTKLCIACDISGVNESIKTMKIQDWKNADKAIYHKRPVVYVLGN